MSDSVRPHRWQPTRLPRPWDSPGKNTGVGCHCLLQCTKMKSESEVTQSCPTLSDPMDCSPPGSSVHGIFQARVLEWGAIAFSVPLLGMYPEEENMSLKRYTHSNVHQFSCSVVSNSLWPHGLQHARLTYPSLTPGVYSNSCPLSWWYHPTISSSVVVFPSHLQSSPASGSFPMTQLFTLFTIAETWKQPKCPSTDKQIKRMWSITQP